MSEKNGLPENELIEHIQNSPIVWAAITECVHRFYHDRCLSDKNIELERLEATNARNILSILWNLNPSWRHTLSKTAAKYNPAFTHATSIYGKPKQKIDISFTIHFDKKESHAGK